MFACFIGHRVIEQPEKVDVLLKDTVIQLIDKGVSAFLFGNKSVFDDLSLKVVTELKENYPSIKRVYVRSAYKYLDFSYEKYLLSLYDETYFPAKLENAGKYSYVERNYEMIDKSKYCVFYCNEKYNPISKGNSGTKIAYSYAVKKKKEIINLYKML